MRQDVARSLSRSLAWRPDAGAQSLHRDARPLGGRGKRLLDVTVAALTLILAAPLMAMIAVLVTCCDGGSPFYGHRRVGYRGRIFRCWKFRTMARDADARLQALLESDPRARALWFSAYKLENDPRVTWIGRALRKSSLDELPQLFNVLRGDMSCVGPRPVIVEELAKYGAVAALYIGARPGMTGLWQVRGRSRAGYETRVALDADYLTNWSMARDLRILAETVPAVLDAGATS